MLNPSAAYRAIREMIDHPLMHGVLLNEKDSSRLRLSGKRPKRSRDVAGNPAQRRKIIAELSKHRAGP